MNRDYDWMRAVLEDVRAYCEEHNLHKSEEAIRKALYLSQLEVANEDQPITQTRKH